MGGLLTRNLNSSTLEAVLLWTDGLADSLFAAALWTSLRALIVGVAQCEWM